MFSRIMLVVVGLAATAVTLAEAGTLPHAVGPIASALGGVAALLAKSPLAGVSK